MAAASGQSYLSKDGDVLDRVVFDFYGSTSGGRVETVLAANTGLAALGPVYPAGVEIFLPDIAADDERVETVQLWA